MLLWNLPDFADELSVHPHMSAQTNTLWPISQLSESYSALHSHLDHNEDKQYYQPQSFQSSWKRLVSNLINNNMRTQHTHLLHIECRAQYYFAVLEQTTRASIINYSGSQNRPNVWLFWINGLNVDWLLNPGFWYLCRTIYRALPCWRHGRLAVWWDQSRDTHARSLPFKETWLPLR